MSPSPETQTLIEKLFKAGSHFGFSKSRRHPSMKKYIFTHKEGADIIDLEHSAELLQTAKSVLLEAGKTGKTVLLVSTKPETSKLVESFAQKLEMPYVTNRWIGGMLTNWNEIKKRIERMKSLEAESQSGELERKYTKKERVVITREINKLRFNFGGIEKLDRAPHVILIVDPRHDFIAVSEARDLGIPTIAVMSSDCDIKSVTYPVIVNDSQKASVTLALTELTEAYLQGKKEYTPSEPTRPVRTFANRRPARS